MPTRSRRERRASARVSAPPARDRCPVHGDLKGFFSFCSRSDTDKNGSLSQEELLAYLLGAGVEHEEIARIFMALDTDATTQLNDKLTKQKKKRKRGAAKAAEKCLRQAAPHKILSGSDSSCSLALCSKVST